VVPISEYAIYGREMNSWDRNSREKDFGEKDFREKDIVSISRLL
jgi:hypothetical protein